MSFANIGLTANKKAWPTQLHTKKIHNMLRFILGNIQSIVFLFKGDCQLLRFNTEHKWDDNKRGRLKFTEKILSRCYFVHHKSYMDWSETKPNLPPCVTTVYRLVVWRYTSIKIQNSVIATSVNETPVYSVRDFEVPINSSIVKRIL